MTRHSTGPQRSASVSGVNGKAVPVLPLAETIDLSGQASFGGAFAIRCGLQVREIRELRIGAAHDYLFVRVRSEGMMTELSSGLLHEGVRCETWHGVASGESVKGPLLLRCGLRCDGGSFKLEARVQEANDEGDTLIYGNSRFQGAVFGPAAEVGLHDVPGDEIPKHPDRRTGVDGANGHSPGRRDHSCNGVPLPVRRNGSSVRFCPSDEWYEYEVPALNRAAGDV